MRRSTRIWIGSSPSSMADRLNWSYGRPGKGLIDGMGNVHTWQTNPAGRPHHNEYADNQNVGTSVPFQIEPDGYIHDDPFGALTAQQVRQIIHADPNLHQQGSYVDDDWTLDDQIPGVQTDESQGPDWNFIHSGSTDDPDEYSDMLKQWLNGIQPQEPLAAPTPHHETIADLAPGAPVQPAHAPPYWPAGHVPDWADPASEGVTASRPIPAPENPDDETTTGGWLHANERLIEHEISPQQYDDALDEYVATALEPKRGRWLKRLLRRA
jgi:hypothetical protein